MATKQATGMERIRFEEPVKNTIHNLVQTLSVKLDSSARYGLYQEDARGMASKTVRICSSGCRDASRNQNSCAA
jgi:hypothetical protein